MTLRFAVVHEAEADFHIATELADRVLVEAIDWLDDDQLISTYQWIGTTEDGRRLTWTGLAKMAGEMGIEAYGHFDGQPGLPDARAARRALLVLRTTIPDLQGVVLIRDQDNQPKRHEGLKQARNVHVGTATIVIAVAITERESWVICGFDPMTAAERARLDVERRLLGFDPRLRSHDLAACNDDNAVHSPKRVLLMLADGDWGRQRYCWTGTSLGDLRTRGDRNGLANYLDEIRELLAPLIGTG